MRADPAQQARAREAVLQAMHGLLAAAGVRAESRWSDVAGVRLHALEAGEGPAVVLIHGAGGGAANWYGVFGSLARHFRVLAPDLPGFGVSSPVSPQRGLGGQVAGILTAWLDALGVKASHLAGTSFGGLVALRLTERHPGRVRRLVLMDTAGLGPELPVLVRLASWEPLGSAALRPSRRGTKWLLRRLLTSGRPLDPAIEPALLEYLYRSGRAADRAILARAYRLFGGIRGQREVLGDDELAKIASPTLVIWGTRDAFFPASHAERAAAQIPRAVVRWIAGAGHSPNWEAPGDVAEAMVGFFRGPGPELDRHRTPPLA